jgi:hypothetical protein
MTIHCAYDQLVRVADLKPHPKNANTHCATQVAAIAAVSEGNGWRAPILAVAILHTRRQWCYPQTRVLTAQRYCDGENAHGAKRHNDPATAATRCGDGNRDDPPRALQAHRFEPLGQFLHSSAQKQKTT